MKSLSQTTTKKDERKPLEICFEKDSKNECKEDDDETDRYLIYAIVDYKLHKILRHLYANYGGSLYRVFFIYSNPMKIRGNRLNTCHKARNWFIVNESKINSRRHLQSQRKLNETTMQSLRLPSQQSWSSTTNKSPRCSILTTSPQNMTRSQRRTGRHDRYRTISAGCIARANH